MAGQSQRIVEIFLPELLVMKGEEKLKTGRAAVLLTEGNGVQHLGLVQNICIKNKSTQTTRRSNT